MIESSTDPFTKINIGIFSGVLASRPEISKPQLETDLTRYYLPYAKSLIELHRKKPTGGLVVGVSAIQGTGKTTQGEIMSALFESVGFKVLSLSIDDYYLPHNELDKLRQKDPRYIRRGVTHDIDSAIKNLEELKNMQTGKEVQVPIYDKGAYDGDGDRSGWKLVNKKPDFIFFDGWMVGARRVQDESVFEKGLPGLDSPEHIQFAKEVNRRLDEYSRLWEQFDFLNVLHVQDYHDSLKWRDQAEVRLRNEGRGMTSDQIKEFVYYFWRSVHPAIQLQNLAYDKVHTQQVVMIDSNHSIREVLTPAEVAIKYPLAA